MKRAALLLLAIAVPASADRFNVTFQDKPVSRAQVCASRAGDLASPMTRFFTGTATVFARRGSELISDTVVLAGGGGTKTHDLALVPAAAVEHDDKPLYAYVPATGAVIPVSDIVPATSIVPLIVRAGHVDAIGTPLTPKATATNRFEFPEEKGSVVVPVMVEGKGEPPRGELGGATQRADASLLFFRNVAPGIQMIRLSGEAWKRAEGIVQARRGEVVVAPPLVARIGRTLRVHWWLRSDLPKNQDCEGKPAKTSRFELSLLDCPMLCTVIDTQTLPENAAKGVLEFRNVAAGPYALRVGKLQKDIKVGDSSDVDFEIRYATFFGRVTRGGKPLHVRLFDTATDADRSEERRV